MRMRVSVSSLMVTVSIVLLGIGWSPIVRAADEESGKEESAATHGEADGHGDAKADDHGEASEAGHGGDEHAADSHGEEHAEGVPLEPKVDLVVWSLVTFVIFIFVLKTFAWGPLISGLDKRESAVHRDIEEAGIAREKAEQMLAEHAAKLEKVQDEVREILAEARRDAEHTKNDIVTTAQKEAEATKDRALAEIKRAEDTAVARIFDEMTDSIADATAHVLGRALSDDDQGRLIDEALAEIGSSRS